LESISGDELEERKIVSTLSGSKYRLGKPMMLPVLSSKAMGGGAGVTAGGSAASNKKASGASAPPNKSASSSQSSQQSAQFTTTMKSVPALMREARQKLKITGEVVGDDDRQYLLTSEMAKSTSGKSRIYKAYLADDDGLPSGEAVLAKLSKNWEAIEREHDNYSKITKTGVARGQFVRCLNYFPTASEVTRKYKDESALILERGRMDLKRYVSVNGKLNGKELRAAAACAAQCLQAVHSSGLVWTDMKTENFVVLKDGSVRGIDLESAMPVKDNPVDYSPEATPPEFAEAFLDGDGPYFPLEYNYDIWSFGMMLYELSSGRGYFDGKAPITITKLLKSKPTIDLSKEDMDKNLKDLIQKCLNVDPTKRPNILQILLHPYFITTGIGPISF
jgi:serine/threonine protein kinase